VDQVATVAFQQVLDMTINNTEANRVVIMVVLALTKIIVCRQATREVKIILVSAVVEWIRMLRQEFTDLSKRP